MRRITVILCGVILCGGLFWLFPLFHVVRLETIQAMEHEATFNAADFCKSFWDKRLIPSLNQAADARMIVKAFLADQPAAREKFGRKVGMSRTRLMVLRGSGKVVTVDKTGVGIALEQNGSAPDIILLTGLLFSNTVRDATGLLDPGDFPNSQHFNEISSQLNQIVETRVIPTLKDQAVIGRSVQFAGCAEIHDDSPVNPPLKVIPLAAGTE